MENPGFCMKYTDNSDLNYSCFRTQSLSEAE